MRCIAKGFKLIGLGLAQMVVGAVMWFVRGFQRMVRAYRKAKLKRCTAYCSKYGYEVSLNSRIKVQGKAYYVLSFETYEDFEHKREVRLNLIGVPQYREIKRRIKSYENQ